jgi:hypothetical protein
MKTWLDAVLGAVGASGLLMVGGCGGNCLDDGWAWQQGAACENESASGTESASASATDSGNSAPTEASNSNSASASESASNSNSNSATATDTATATETATATDTGGGMWCADTDGDGFGDPAECMDSMFPGSVPNDDDCDDTNPNTFPGSAEKDSETACQKDEDGDGYGDMNPPGGVDPGTDCNDADAEVQVDCACAPNAAKCEGDDLHVCNDAGTMEDITTCEFGCDDGGLKCWDALTVDAGPSLCVDPNMPVQLNATAMGGDGVYGYAWTPADTLDNAAIQNPNATPAGVTQYTVDVSDGEGNMASDSVSVFVKDQALTLSPDICTVYDFPHEVNAENQDPVSKWVWNDNTKELCETLNSKAAALFCGWELDNATITGTFAVKTADDDDWPGFMWGIQDTSHFYIFTWKQAGQLATTCGNIQVPAGMQVKVVNVQDEMMNPLACVDLLAPADTANSKLLLSVDDFTTTGWADNTQYRFTLTHKNTGEMKISVNRANNNMLVAEKTFMDTTYASGQFGMYAKSQVNTCFSDFKVSCEP